MGAFEPTAAVERLKTAFEKILLNSPRGGASLSLWKNGAPILSLHGGEASPGMPWLPETPCLIWSASKGIAAAVTLHALQEKEIPLMTKVSRLWPEFGSEGKGEITLAELLSHRAGLAAIDRKGIPITDHPIVVEALASQPPNWTPDGSHGYGARTFGFLVDEIVRRVTGNTLADRWNRIFREPLCLELWFGLPPDKLGSAATVIAPTTPPAPSPFSKAFGDPTSLTRRALSEPGGALTPSVMNSASMRMESLPSLGAISTAEALAQFYALLAGEGGGFFKQETLVTMQTHLAKGHDLVLMDNTSFSAGFMTNEFGVYGPGKTSFGHPGAGGSLAFADPEAGIGFAFIPSTMHPGALPGERTRKLVQALYGTSLK
jgi:CubicO group peptidase (beta-lactamase class C family)